jgi:hypothetical protein
MAVFDGDDTIAQLAKNRRGSGGPLVAAAGSSHPNC